jgi:hypothetical protein
MFDPISIALMLASAVATAGGNRLNQLAANKAIKGQVGLERIRQQKFQADSDQNFRNALEDFNPQNMQDNLAKATTSRDSAISGNLADPSGGYEAANNNQPEVVKSSIAKSLSDAVAKSKGQAKRLAALGSTGEVFGNKAIDLGRSASKGAMIGNFAQGSAKTSLAEQAAAGQTRSGFGDALGLAGQAISIGNMLTAPGRVGDSIFGAEVAKPSPSMDAFMSKITKTPVTGSMSTEYDPFGLIKNKFGSVF